MPDSHDNERPSVEEARDLHAPPEDSDRQRTRAREVSRAERTRDRAREALREWKRQNPDKVKQYRETFRAAHLERIRAENRERERARRKERQARDVKRAYAREWYARNRDDYLEYQRGRRAAQKAADPDRYREMKKARNKRWRDSHKDQENAKLRVRYWDNPDVKAKRAANYYKTHTDEVRARRRARYAANRDRERATQERYRQRVKARRDAGLPPRQRHHTPRDERLAHADAANEFFARPRTREEVALLRKELGTPPQVIAAWMRDCKRARAAHQFAEEQEMRRRLGIQPPGPTPKQIEEARLDAIAKEVNQRLRHAEPPRRVHHLDPTAPHPMLQHGSHHGLSR